VVGFIIAPLTLSAAITFIMKCGIPWKRTFVIIEDIVLKGMWLKKGMLNFSIASTRKK